MTDVKFIELASKDHSAKAIAIFVRTTAAISSAARTNRSEDVTGPSLSVSQITSAVAAGAVALATAPNRIAVGSGNGKATADRMKYVRNDTTAKAAAASIMTMTKSFLILFPVRLGLDNS